MGSRMGCRQTACHSAHGHSARRYRARARTILASRVALWHLASHAVHALLRSAPPPCCRCLQCRPKGTDRSPSNALSLHTVAGAGGMDTEVEAGAPAQAAHEVALMPEEAESMVMESILNAPSIFGFKSMLVQQPAFLNWSPLALSLASGIPPRGPLCSFAAIARPPLHSLLPLPPRDQLARPRQVPDPRRAPWFSTR